MGILAVPDDEQLTINNFDLFTPACSPLNSYVMDQGPSVVIDNTDIPEYPGERSEQAWDTGVRWTLAMAVIGDVDFDGVDHANARVGLRENWTSIKEEVFLPILSYETLWAVWVFRGETRTANIQVGNWQITGAAAAEYATSFDLIIPAGDWTVGS